ncbi:hypothetical protein GQ55_6G197600 [Panicum hallii var. hallii]|uniref:Uncharacterized protein n=1 Tax=Panicum hallii var. hallii TaxID=1504633 RepID=A0A2T7D7M9_9POAL|nr:hypothetical protein GQ55_6G197600 [Panicum hallii var. hallii]
MTDTPFIHCSTRYIVGACNMVSQLSGQVLYSVGSTTISALMTLETPCKAMMYVHMRTAPLDP